MKKTAKKPLSLDRQTIRALAGAELVRGGVRPRFETDDKCVDSRDWYCPYTQWVEECLPLP